MRWHAFALLPCIFRSPSNGLPSNIWCPTCCYGYVDDYVLNCCSNSQLILIFYFCFDMYFFCGYCLYVFSWTLPLSVKFNNDFDLRPFRIGLTLRLSTWQTICQLTSNVFHVWGFCQSLCINHLDLRKNSVRQIALSLSFVFNQLKTNVFHGYRCIRNYWKYWLKTTGRWSLAKGMRRHIHVCISLYCIYNS